MHVNWLVLTITVSNLVHDYVDLQSKNDTFVLGELPHLGRRVRGQVAPNEHEDHVLVPAVMGNEVHKNLVEGNEHITDHEKDDDIFPPLQCDVREGTRD